MVTQMIPHDLDPSSISNDQHSQEECQHSPSFTDMAFHYSVGQIPIHCWKSTMTWATEIGECGYVN